MNAIDLGKCSFSDLKSRIKSGHAISYSGLLGTVHGSVHQHCMLVSSQSFLDPQQWHCEDDKSIEEERRASWRAPTWCPYWQKQCLEEKRTP